MGPVKIISYMNQLLTARFSICMEAEVLSALSKLGLSIERGDDQSTLRGQHEQLHAAVTGLVAHFQEFKMDTICQIHAQNSDTVAPNEWFITPFDAYIKS